MGITAFIPARGGSKGIKNKNIINIAGKPLIYWVCFALQKSDLITRIVVATDCKNIKNTALSFGFDKVEVYNRLPQNAADDSKTIDVVLEWINAEKPNVEDLLCLVQTTSPLLTSEDINKCIKEYADSGCDSIFGCVKFPRICWTSKGVPLNHNLKNRKRRQEMDYILVENGAIYINKYKNILKQKQLLTGDIKPFIMSYDTITELDEPKDIPIVEKLLKERLKPNIKDYKIFLTDCDGCLTDGGMYYSETGESMKKFNTTDGMGINLLKKAGFYVGIVTGEATDFARKRAEKLGIDCYCGIKDKLECVRKIAKEQKVSLSEIIYVGDDINDLEVIKTVGYSACPENAQKVIKDNVNYVSSVKGGDGAVRDIINQVI